MAFNYGTQEDVLSATQIAVLASSSTLIAGMSSKKFQLTENTQADYVVNGQIKVNIGTSPTSHTAIMLFAYTAHDNSSSFNSIFVGATSEGSAGSATLHSQEVRSNLRLIWSTPINSTPAHVYSIENASVAEAFPGGIMPKAWAYFLTHNTGQVLQTASSSLSCSSFIRHTPVDYI